MGITVQFTSGSNASGLMCNAFVRDNVGPGLFFKFTETATVSGDVAKFSTISVPGEYAFRVDSAAGTRWRSGPLLMQGANVTNTYWVFDAGTISFTPAQLSGMLPTPPLTSGAATITSIVLTLGTGTITATGSGFYVDKTFGVIPITYTYVFTLDADSDPANYEWPNGVPPAITVRTISLAVMGAAGGGLLGFLYNSLVSALFSLVASTIQQSIERRVQTAIDTAVANALAAQKAPVGTIATAESVTILAGGVSIRVFAGIDLTKACASTPSGGSVKVRPPEQLHHLRTIRDRVLRHSPQGLAYIDLFEKFSPELVRILLSNEDLLKRVDDLVSRLLVSFPADNPGAGRLPQELANTVVDIMDMVAASVSPELAMTIKALRDEVFTFVDRPAEEVLAESLKLVQ